MTKKRTKYAIFNLDLHLAIVRTVLSVMAVLIQLFLLIHFSGILK